jgi:hypothetical protein
MNEWAIICNTIIQNEYSIIQVDNIVYIKVYYIAVWYWPEFEQLADDQRNFETAHSTLIWNKRVTMKFDNECNTNNSLIWDMKLIISFQQNGISSQ